MKIINNQTNNKYILKTNDICNKKNIINKQKLIMGKYNSSSLKVLDDEKIKPNLIKINSLNENYIKEELNPNKFTTFKCGKLTFKIYIKYILSDINKKTLEFNIYINNKLRKTIEKSIEKRINKNVLLLTNLEVKKDDVIYFDYSIKNKKGKLLLNNIDYEIKFSFQNILEGELKSLINKNISKNLNSMNEANCNIQKINLNDKEIKKTFIKEEMTDTSLVTLVDSTTESISRYGENQKIANQENAINHIIISNDINNSSSKINSILGKISDEKEITEYIRIPERVPSFDQELTPVNITRENRIYFLKSLLSYGSYNTVSFKNSAWNLIGENVNVAFIDSKTYNDQPLYTGFYMNIVSNEVVTFEKFTEPLDENNNIQGIEKISEYYFNMTNILATSTTLSESYLNYDFLLIKSQIDNNQQTIFNIVKTDKIVSNVAINYYPELEYITFTDEANFTTSDSSLVGIWGFKVDYQLNKIAVLSNKGDFSFSEQWRNYQFLFVSYHLNGVLGGTLIATNQIELNDRNQFSIEGDSYFIIKNELEGTFGTYNQRQISDIEVYGLNHILKDEASILNTSKIPTANSELEGGENQSEVNENVQNILKNLDESKADKSDLISSNTAIIQNSADLESIKNGTYDYPQLTLNGEVINKWPSGEADSSLSSLIIDDNDENPDEGINPWKTKIDENTDAIADNALNTADIIDGTIPINSKSSLASDDSDTKPNEGINPYLIQTKVNTINIENLNTGVDNLNTEIEGIINGTTPIPIDSNSSNIKDNSSTNPLQGINPWKTKIDENTDAIADNALNTADIIDGIIPINSKSSLASDDSNTKPNEGINPWKTKIDENTDAIADNALNTADIIDGTIPINSKSSLASDDSNTKPNEGINPYLIQTKVNTINIENLNTGVDNLNTEIEGIINGTTPIPIDSNSSNIKDNSSTNPLQGINPWKTKIDENALDISLKANKEDLDATNSIVNQNNTDLTTIKEGSYNYPQLTLNGKAITQWPESEEGISKSSELEDDSNLVPNEGINPSLNQITNNQNEILELKNQMESLKLPIGSIIISVIPPSYGVWTTLGTLAEGQAIIGGSSSNGNIISHNHQWSTGVTTFSAGLVIGIGNSINKFTTYNQTGGSKTVGSNVFLDNNDTSQTAWTSLTGGEDKNKAYGLGIGTGMRIFRRES